MHKHRAVLSCLALMLLVGCANESTTGGVAPVATTTHTSTPTATPPMPSPMATTAPAATPTNVPAGWQVLAARYFAIAYPSEWVAQAPVPITDTTIANAVGYTYDIKVASDGRTLSILERRDSEIAAAYCHIDNSVAKILAGATMRYSVTGSAQDTRDWVYADSHGTLFDISINDALSPAHRTLDDMLLATLRLDDLTPFTC